MIVGIGVDIAQIDRFEKLLERFGNRVAERLLTEREQAQFAQRNHSATFLASRFAAKEALSKALGSGIAGGIGFRSIEVVNDAQGKPELELHDQALLRMQQNKVSRSLLSLSHEKQYAVAMVVLERD